MTNFLIKFFNISTIIFLFNIVIFHILNNFFPLQLALILTLVIIFILNFIFISYSFDIKKNKFFFFFGLILISVSFRVVEYFLFENLMIYIPNPTLAWTTTISTTFVLKIIFYKPYFNMDFFKNRNLKKKVFIFTPDYKNGGAEKNVLLLAQSLNKKKFDITLVAWKYSKIKIKGVKKIIIRKKNLKSSFFTIFFLIIKKNPDYIFSSLNHLNIFLGIIRIISGTRSKQIIRESNYLSYKLKDEYNNKIRKVFARKFLTFITYNSCEIVICPSKEIHIDLRNNFKVKKEILKFIPNLFEKKLFTKKNSLFNNQNLISVGRLEAQKDHTFMIEAFKESLKIKDNKLLIIGNGSEREKITKLIKKLSLQKKIKIINFQKNIDKFLINSKAILMTSRYEGMPNIILESCNYGIKCLLTDFPGSSFFKKYENIKISKKIVKQYAKEIANLDAKRIFPKSFENEFLKDNQKKKFLECFNS